MRGLAGLLLFAGLAAGQPPDTVPAAATQPGPGSHGWPTTASPTVPPGLPSGTATAETRSPGAPIPQFRPPVGFPPEPPNYPQAGDLGYGPLPGSLADDYAREYAERQRLRSCDFQGRVYTTFPGTLLWEPPLALKREPRLEILGTSLNNLVNDSTLDANIGTVVGLTRVRGIGHDVSVQLDLFANVLTRLSPEDLIATDYRFGFPLTARWGDWQSKLAYEHTSAHLGDEFLRNTGRRPINFAKDEIVVGLGRFLPEYDLRLYGQVSYAFFQDLAGDPERYRYDLGGQWTPRPAMGGGPGAPYVAVNVDFRGEQDYEPNVAAQVGYQVRNPFQRLAGVRVFVEYRTGKSLFGQFFRDQETFTAVGLAGEF